MAEAVIGIIGLAFLVSGALGVLASISGDIRPSKDDSLSGCLTELLARACYGLVSFGFAWFGWWILSNALMI